MLPWVAGEFLPDLLGDEGHEGVQEAEHGAEHPEQDCLAVAAGGRVLFIIELGLDEFQVPVAELVPDELVQHVGRLIEGVGVQRLPGLPDDLLEAAQDPGLHRGSGVDRQRRRTRLPGRSPPGS